ncbi:MAG TPA: hypothetical protein V6D05_11695 [Stenomitos sp.]
MHIGQAFKHYAHQALHKVQSTFHHAAQFVKKEYKDHFQMSDNAGGRYGGYDGRMG